MVLSALLASLSLYSFLSAPEHLTVQQEYATYAEERSVPEKFAYARVLEELGEGKARVLLWDQERVIVGSQEELEKGDIVSFTGRYTPFGQIQVETVTLHELRRLKKFLSLIAALIICVLLIHRAWRLFFREKKCRT